MTEIYAKLFGKNFENFKFLYIFKQKTVDIRWDIYHMLLPMYH